MIFVFFQCIHQNVRFAWECLLHVFPSSWESKVMMLKKPKIKKEVRKRIFSFPHIFSSLNVFHFYYLERLDLKINLGFYLNSTVRERGMIYSLLKLKWLQLEGYISCNGDIFFIWVFLQTLFLSNLYSKIQSSHDLK